MVGDNLKNTADISDIEKRIALKQLEIKEQELEGRGFTQNKVVAISALISLVSATVVALITSYYARDSLVSQSVVEKIGAEIVQKLKGESDESIAKIQAQNSLDLEREKLQRDLISDAINAGGQEETRNRLLFFTEVGLLPSFQEAILAYIEETQIEDLPSAVNENSSGFIFDKNYSSRGGYDEQFLSAHIPLPEVDASVVLVPETLGEATVRYHNYSVILAKETKTALLAAANVDFSNLTSSDFTRREFGSEKWIYDPRISVDAQLGGNVYKAARKVDRGHLISRTYVAWGESLSDVRFANSDAFHWTNATLQNEIFNRSNRRGPWGEIENRSYDFSEKFSVFTGPISEDRGVYLAPEITVGKSIRFPLRFWKVFVDDGQDGLNVIAFIFHQPIDNMLDELSFSEGWSQESADDWQPGAWVVSLAELEKEIGYLKFPEILHAYDAVRLDKWSGRELTADIKPYSQR